MSRYHTFLQAPERVLTGLSATASPKNRVKPNILICVSMHVAVQSEYDRNSKEVSPFQSAFTRQRESWAGRTASKARPLHLLGDITVS